MARHGSPWRAWLGGALALLGAGALPAAPAWQDIAHVAQAPHAAVSDRIIVKWRAEGSGAVLAATAQERAHLLNASWGLGARGRNLFGRTDVMQLDHQPGALELAQRLAQLRSDPRIEYAEVDGYRYVADFPASAPNDPHFLPSSDPSNANNPDLQYGTWQGQWYLQPSSASVPAALDVLDAWKTTTGSSSVVVGVIDTGIIENHPDFSYGAGVTPSKLQCSTGSGGQQICGYDFVSCDQGNNTSTTSNSSTTGDCSASGSAATYDFANDGHGWAPDASDPGDWLASTDVTLPLFQNAGCTTAAPSSWHGTKVAGVIGAVTNNGIGIAGIAPKTTLLIVRALGKCSGRTSDIAAAILWAAGQPVTVPGGGTSQASPAANIINLSLAAPAPCSNTEQDAINQAIAAGVLVVAAAGNEGGPLDAPANCSGVLSVVGLRHAGTKVEYSNLSSSSAAATIAAPGGNCVNTGNNNLCLYDIETASDSGATTPAAVPGFYTYSQLSSFYLASGLDTDNGQVVGTSFAAPMVAGTAALMLAAQPGLTPTQLITRLQSSAVPFPTSSSTTSTACQLAADTTNSSGAYTDTTQAIECVCSTSTCGAGMLNAMAAVQAASGIYVQISASDTTALAGQHIRVDGTASTPSSGASIVSWQWSTDPATTDQFINGNQSVATFVVPSFRSIKVLLTITDSAGKTATGSIEIYSGLSGGSGGGGMDVLLLLTAVLLLGWRLRAQPPRGPLLN